MPNQARRHLRRAGNHLEHRPQDPRLPLRTAVRARSDNARIVLDGIGHVRLEELSIASVALVTDARPLPDAAELPSSLIADVERMHAVTRQPGTVGVLRLRLGGHAVGQLSLVLKRHSELADRAALGIFERARRRGDLRSHDNVELLRDMFLGAVQYPHRWLRAIHLRQPRSSTACWAERRAASPSQREPFAGSIRP